MKPRAIAAAAVLLAAIPAAASAQRWGRERFPQSGACFFQDADFRGEYFCVPAGTDVRAVPDEMNDQISSVRIFGRAEVRVFRDVRFGGDSARFGSDVRNLRDEGWNDRISSLRVDAEGRQGRGDRFGDLNDAQRGRDRRGEEPERIIRRAYEDVLGREPDEPGLRQYRSRIIDDGWTEEQVRNSLRASPEFRERSTMTRARAEEIVKRAYANVLRRDPDASAEGFIQRILRDRWSQEDVERELRKSDEFRNRR